MALRGVVFAAGATILAVALAVVAVDATTGLPWAAEDRPERPPSAVTPLAPSVPDWPQASSVLDLDDPSTGPSTSSGPALADVLEPAVGAPELGGRVGVSVIDLTAGTPVYDAGADTAQTPASTLKILTTAAALDVLGPGHTFTTRVVTAGPVAPGQPGQLVLVGAGDPLLTAGDAPHFTHLSDLADATAAALAEDGVASVQLAVDDSLFTGPAVDPDWRPGYVSSGVVSPVSALAVDGGRTTPEADSRSADPAVAAGEAFAAMLVDRGIGVDGATARGVAPAAATDLATVESPPLSTAVEHVLETSDNDGAEVLARHVAVATGLPGTSADASTAVVQTISALGIDLSQATVLDGSGLARGSAVPAAAIAATVALAAAEDHPGLRSVITGLPVAGFTGTLDDRFGDTAGEGVVRAKTGTLTGVSGLAGVAVGADGRSFAFAALADQVDDTVGAREGLDDIADALATCGCS